MRTLLFVSVALVAACGGRTIGTPDQNNNQNDNRLDGSVPGPDGRVLTDGGVTPDGGLCEAEEWWELQAAPLSEITVLNPALGGDGIPQGVTVRVKTTVTITGCDELAGVQAEVHPDDHLVILAGYIWRYHGPAHCPSLLEEAPEFLALRRLRAGTWSLLDILINNIGVPIEIRACDAAEDCQCDAWQGTPGGWGETCSYDCMCQGSLGCVYEPSTPTCYETCSVTADCPIPLFCNNFLPQTPEGVCLSTGLIEECLSDLDCAEGFACLPVEGSGRSWCQAAMATQPVGLPCNYNCECPPGFGCTDTGDGDRSCQIRCRGNLDCPSGMVCDPRGSGTDHVANLLICNFQ